MGKLDNKVAVITGSARGIGYAFAKAYIAEGATVVIADINAEHAQKAANALGNQAYSVALDVGSHDSITAAVKTIEQKSGRIDILVNNAALFDLAPIVDITEASYQKLFQVNVYGTLFMLLLFAQAKHTITELSAVLPDLTTILVAKV